MPKLKEVRYDVVASSDKLWVDKVTNFIRSKGFCTVKLDMKVDGSVADDLKKIKLEGGLRAPPAEVDDGLLGSEGSSAIMTIDGSRPELKGFNTSFEAISNSFQPLMRTLMGPGETKVTPSLLHITGEPEDEDDRPALTNAECTEYDKIFTTHRLMLVYFFGPGQGSMEMEPFFMQEVSPYIQTTEPGMLLLLRPDMLTHRHFSNRETAALSSFILQDVKDAPVRTPTTDMLRNFAMERMASKDLEDDFQVVPKEWRSEMNKSQLSGPQVAARSLACHYPVSWDPKDWWFPTMFGIDQICEVPFTRWDITKMYDPDPDSYKQWKTCSKHMSFMDGLDQFDNKFFGLSPAETKSMDPQQRHILEVSYDALFTCGFTKKSLSRSLIGVFLGCCCQMEWGMMPMDAESGGAATTGGAASINSNRISFCLGMQGPSYTLDLNAAASLVAVTQAYNSQRYQTETYKPCHTALGGAMYISFIAHNFVATCAMGFMSNKGRSFTFDATANGWVKGEGLAVTAMQRLGEVVDGKTVIDNDKPYLGTIAGGAVGHVGTTSGFNAPSGPVEQGLIHGAVRQAQVAASDIDCVEACGDGRFLYDAVEAMALSNALRLNESNPLVLCAVKTCAGMQHEVTGMSQLMRSLYNLRTGIFAPSNHLIEMNPHIDVWQEDSGEDRPLVFATELLPVKSSANFIGMTARAHGGTISHVIAFCQVDEKLRPSSVPTFSVPKISFWPGGGGKLDDAAKPQNTYHIVGSWSNFTTPQPMVKDGKDLYSVVVTIGANGFEQFQLCLDGDMEKMLHPDSPAATFNSSVYGPSLDDDAKGLQWVIGASSSLGDQLALTDSRIASPGDKYLVKLRVAGRWRVVDWECCETSSSSVEPVDDGVYYIAANWNGWCCEQELAKISPGKYEAEIVLPSNLGKFQLVRNKDWSQVFYPLGNKVEGPGAAPYSSCWSLEGSVGDTYRITMQRLWQGRAFTTTVSCTKVGAKNVADLGEPVWPRYFLSVPGTASKFEMEPLSNLSYGITLQLTTGPVQFHILNDGDSRRAFYPSEIYTTAKRRHTILGPDVAPDARNCWIIRRDLDDRSEEGGWYTVEMTVNLIDKTPASVYWLRTA